MPPEVQHGGPEPALAREGAGRDRQGRVPRVLALHLPDFPLQRLRRASLDATGEEAGSARRRGEGEARAIGAAGGRRPVAVLDEGRVACCDPEACAAGVRPGMTAAEALGACGLLELVPHDAAGDRAALRALAEALLSLAPAVEVATPDALLLDASAAHLVAGARPGRAGAGSAELVEAAERRLAACALALVDEMGYSARAAVATGRSPARALAGRASLSQDVLRWIPPGATREALAPLPIAALGLPLAVAKRLAALGVVDAGGLARLPEGTLAHRFGPEGVQAARLARGEDASPLVPYVPATLPEEGAELEGPAEAVEPLLFVLKRLADRVAARLAGRGLGATRLKLVLGLDPRGEERVEVPLAQPTAAVARWLGPLKEHLFSLRLPAAVVALRLVAVEVAPVALEQLAFGDRPEAVAALEGVLSRLAVRLGDGALFTAEPVERYRPERAYREVPFRTTPRRPQAVPPAGAAAPEEHASRPTRLLPVPELVVAEGEGGRLTALRVGGRDRAVLSFQGPERLAGEWWSERFDRDYYRVRLDGLGDCWIYRDGADGRLFLHGFFD